jgi:hypothetical protein
MKDAVSPLSEKSAFEKLKGVCRSFNIPCEITSIAAFRMAVAKRKSYGNVVRGRRRLLNEQLASSYEDDWDGWNQDSESLLHFCARGSAGKYSVSKKQEEASKLSLSLNQNH